MPQLDGNVALRYQQLRHRLTFYESVKGMPHQYVMIERLKTALQRNTVPGALVELYSDAEYDRLVDELKNPGGANHGALVQIWALVTNASPLPASVRDSILQHGDVNAPR